MSGNAYIEPLRGDLAGGAQPLKLTTPSPTNKRLDFHSENCWAANHYALAVELISCGPMGYDFTAVGCSSQESSCNIEHPRCLQS